MIPAHQSAEITIILLTTQLRSQCYLDTHLATEDELEHPHDEHPGDAHEKGQDGGQEEAPPLPLLQTFLRVQLSRDKRALTSNLTRSSDLVEFIRSK